MVGIQGFPTLPLNPKYASTPKYDFSLPAPRGTGEVAHQGFGVYRDVDINLSTRFEDTDC